MIYIKSLGLGILLGAIFTYLRLPIPSPNNFPAILGIIGIFIGNILIDKLK